MVYQNQVQHCVDISTTLLDEGAAHDLLLVYDASAH